MNGERNVVAEDGYQTHDVCVRLIAEAVQAARAEAWDEGHRSFCAMQEHYFADHVHPKLNPYRAALADREATS